MCKRCRRRPGDNIIACAAVFECAAAAASTALHIRHMQLCLCTHSLARASCLANEYFACKQARELCVCVLCMLTERTDTRHTITRYEQARTRAATTRTGSGGKSRRANRMKIQIYSARRLLRACDAAVRCWWACGSVCNRMCPMGCKMGVQKPNECVTGC